MSMIVKVINFQKHLLMCVGEAIRFALNSLAVEAFDWLFEHSDPEWLNRYGHQIEEARLLRSQTERQAVAEVIGRDGSMLLTDILAPEAPPRLARDPQRSGCYAACGCKITSG